MKPDDSSPAHAAEFRPTRWSVVLLSAQSNAPGSFLLASLQNYPSKETDRARCLKRGGQGEFVRLDAQDAADRYRLEPTGCLTAERIFDARWALTLLDKAMSLLCAEYVGQGKEKTLETLKPFLHPIDSETLPSYEQVADQLTLSVGAVRTLIHRLRKRYTALLRAEVARTVSDSGEIDEEIHALCDALIASEGRLV